MIGMCGSMMAAARQRAWRHRRWPTKPEWLLSPQQFSSPLL